MDLKIDNQKQTIQGVHISDPKKFADLRLIVRSEAFEGWKPTSDDIQFLLDHSYSTPGDEARIKEIINKKR